MSRNFELLSHLGKDLGSTNFATVETTGTASRPIAAQVVGALKDCADGREILQLTQRIFLYGNGNAPRQVLFCGVDDDAGSSVVCAQVARMLAQKIGSPVCAVDASPQPSTLSLMFGVEAMLPSDGAVRDHCQKVHANLWLANPSVLRNSAGSMPSPAELRARLTELRSSFEFVLIHAPAANLGSDAAVIGQAVDAAVLVIEAGSTRRASAKRAKDVLEDARVRVLGTVLNNRTFPIPEPLYRRL